MKTVIKILVLGSLPLLLFACPSRPPSGCDQPTTQQERDACERTSGWLPAQVRETPRPA